MIKCILLVEQELDFERQGVEIFFDFIAQTFDLLQTGLVFLCGDDEFGRGESIECLVDAVHILLLEIVMIAEGQWGHLLGIGLQIDQHLFGRGNACQKQDVLVGQG